MTLDHAWALFIRMLDSYGSFGWPFALLHLIIISLAFQSMLEMWKTLTCLQAWGSTGTGKNPIARALDELVLQKSQWAAQGVFVPIEHLSRRIEEDVSAHTERFHGLVNLLLVVGIAGTFFAMFQFSDGASANNKEFIIRLRDSLSQAFPVGFVGLLMMIGGHILSALIEVRIESALNKALDRAADEAGVRARKLKKEQERALEESQAAQKAEEEARSKREQEVRQRELENDPVRQLVIALKPLGDLQGVLAGSLKEVIQKFDNQLDVTQKLIAEQIRPLADAVSGFQSSVGKLESAASQTSTALSELPTRLDVLRQMQEEARRQLEQVGKLTESSMGDLSRAAASLQVAADSIRKDFGVGLSDMQTKAEELWIESSQKHFAGISPATQAIVVASNGLIEAVGQMRGLPGSLEGVTAAALGRFIDEASVKWNEVSSAYWRDFELMRTSLGAATEALAGQANGLGDSSNRIVVLYENAIDGLRTATESDWKDRSGLMFKAVQADHLERVGEIQSSVTEVHGKIGDAADALKTLSTTTDDALKTAFERLVKETSEKMTPQLGELWRIVSDRYPSVVTNLEQSAQESRVLAENSQKAAIAVGELMAQMEAVRTSWSNSGKEFETSMRAAANEESKVLAENSKRTVTAIGELLAQMEAVRTSWSNSGKEFEASMRSAASQVRADVERVMKDAVANAPKAVVRDPLDGIQPVPFKRPRWVSLRYRVDLTGLFSRKNRQEHEDTPDSFTDTAPIEKPDTSFDKSDPFGERVQKQGLTRFVKRLFSRKSDG